VRDSTPGGPSHQLPSPLTFTECQRTSWPLPPIGTTSSSPARGPCLRALDQGHRTAILDLTAGETGTRGSAALRAQEAEAAAKILGVTERRNAGLPDAHLENTEATRRSWWRRFAISLPAW
jgi:hypothetical protein